jgi:hypothetical protein
MALYQGAVRRRQALAGLKAELAAWCTHVESEMPRNGETVSFTVERWRKASDVVDVRETGSLEKFPEAG